MRIKLHSMTDLITNSSTVIYTYSDASEQALRNMIDEFFTVFGINKKCDDVFNISLMLEQDWKYAEGVEDLDEVPPELADIDPRKRDQAVNSLVEAVKEGKVSKPDWMAKIEQSGSSNYDSYPPGTELFLTPKAPEYQKLADLVEKFLYSTTHEASYDG